MLLEWTCRSEKVIVGEKNLFRYKVAFGGSLFWHRFIKFMHPTVSQKFTRQR